METVYSCWGDSAEYYLSADLQYWILEITRTHKVKEIGKMWNEECTAKLLSWANEPQNKDLSKALILEKLNLIRQELGKMKQPKTNKRDREISKS